MAPAPRISIGTFPVRLRHVFRHASGEHAQASNVIVMIEDADGLRGWGEGCPRPYVTGETCQSAVTFLKHHGHDLVSEVQDANGLRRWISEHEAMIDSAPASYCALELATLDLFG
ncbi:MAG: hypothetical protein P8Q36_19510 [Alphaproteobacteria bacterium]|jgi:L-Ala-D/L-Glu epimerase|nr:hypothetical protein [Rhodospirillaceae bacterium]MDG2483029.1 hypothetical protein [Alphaproteobacteria bacterium]MBT6204714.1 hypothetical protein [Rhodospirillaceae bacterium]MBT6512380.1 hypothetical protein [Rhodospirillaceae bacterium]MBT7612004.1 hypothetical protein [Rhodospirillaceae bacterium]